MVRRPRAIDKSFLVLFFKKELLPSSVPVRKLVLVSQLAWFCRAPERRKTSSDNRQRGLTDRHSLIVPPMHRIQIRKPRELPFKKQIDLARGPMPLLFQ